MTSVHNVVFHVWHFLYQQVQLPNWFGNIVAGLASFVLMSLFWPKARAAYVRFFARHFDAVHAKLDQHHREHIDLAKYQHKKSEAAAERRHQEAQALATYHHAAHIAAIAGKAGAGKRDAGGRFTK